MAEVRQYFRHGGYIYVADHVTKTVSAPQSVDESDYPDEVKEFINNTKYKIQLTIE